MTSDEFPPGNRLLSALMATLLPADGRRWRSQLELVHLKRGQVLFEPGRAQRHVHFPTRSVVSLLCTLAGGGTTGIALVGNEGVVGAALLLGANSSAHGGEVLMAGPAFRLGAQMLQDEFERSRAVRDVVLLYIQALTAQIAQNAVCARHHSIEQQLCGFLLHSLDRLRGSEVDVTQDLIAGMLGVRRESVTAAAGHLRDAGLIDWSRGHIAVRDRAGLEKRSCECHAVVKREYDRLVPAVATASASRPVVCATAARAQAAGIRGEVLGQAS